MVVEIIKAVAGVVSAVAATSGFWLFLVAALFLRRFNKQVSDLLDRVRSFKAAGAEVSLAERLLAQERVEPERALLSAAAGAAAPTGSVVVEAPAAGAIAVAIPPAVVAEAGPGGQGEAELQERSHEAAEKYLARTSDDPVILEHENRLKGYMRDMGIRLEDAHDALRVTLRALAGTTRDIEFERIWAPIWVEQIEALQLLNAFDRATREQLEPYLRKVISKWNASQDSISFDDFVGYLVYPGLVERTADGGFFSITPRGRAFLDFLHRMRKPPKS